MTTAKAACLVTVAGLLLTVVARNSSQSNGADLLAHLGTLAVGGGLAICMAALFVLNGGTDGRTVEERIPIYTVRAIAVMGGVVGLGLALRGVFGS